MLLYPLFSTSRVQSELQNGMKDGFDLMAKLCETDTELWAAVGYTGLVNARNQGKPVGACSFTQLNWVGLVLIDKRKQAMYFCINVCHDALICKIFTATVNQNYGLC